MAPAPATIPEELLEEIFLHLPTPDALAWASAACTSFRCVIKGRAFRRRFRALHQPPLLGFIDKAGFHPTEAPHPSVPLAHALAPCAADYSFVPPPVVPELLLDYDEWEGPRWRPRDVRDGRVLLDWTSLHPRVINYPDDASDVGILMDSNELPYLMDPVPLLTWNKRARCNAADFHLAVCDPLSCGYVLLPTIPEDLAAQTQELLSEFQPVLAPTTADAEDQSFKVICIARYETKLALFVFLSTTRQWCIATYPIFILTPPGTLSCFDCVGGCFYWTEPWVWTDHLMVLDTRTMRFSTVNLLTGYHVQLRDLPDQSIVHGRRIAVVVGREGALELFSLICQHGSFALHHTTLQNNSQEWQLEKIIQLPGRYRGYSISTVGAAEGFLFFQGAPGEQLSQNVDCFSLEVKTYEITKICTKMEQFFNRKRALPYFSFPPLLSEPTI